MAKIVTIMSRTYASHLLYISFPAGALGKLERKKLEKIKYHGIVIE